MSTPSTTDADLDKIESAYLRLKPLRDLEASIAGTKGPRLREVLQPFVFTLFGALLLVLYAVDDLFVFLVGAAVTLNWLFYCVSSHGKQVHLIAASLRTIANELNELRKEQP